jgi:ketosteroid isomerase-like protein
MTVTDPRLMNESFARAFNSRNLGTLLALYERDAVLRSATGDRDLAGLDAIAGELQGLLQVPGTMTSLNRFCLRHGDLALLRADWQIVDGAGTVAASGSSVELVRRQADGTWLYVIDHPMGAGPAQTASR